MAAALAMALGVTLLMPDGEQKAPAERSPAQKAEPKADKARAGGQPLDEKAAREKAIRTGKPVEVLALRDTTSTVHALPNGEFRLTTQAAPVRAQVDGEWLPIDTTLHKTDDGWRPKATVNPVTFHSGKTPKKKGERSSRGYARAPLAPTPAIPPALPATDYTDLVTFTTEDRELTVGWPGPLPEPEINGASALYRGVLDGVDLMLTARDTGFTHVLIVHHAKAAADPALAAISYRLTSPELTFSLDDSNDVLSVKDPGGKEVGGSPTPFMWDSGGKPAITQGEAPQDTGAKESAALPGLAGPQIGGKRAPADASLTGGGTTSAILSVTPDRKLLTGKDTVYPVFIDPPLYGKSAAWTTAYETHPSTSFWDGANFNSGTTEGRVGWESTTRGLSRTFYRLSWKSSIKGASISSASFRFRETYSWSCTPTEMELLHTNDISPATTWNNQPATRSVIGSKSFAHGWNSSCPDAYVTYDGRAIAQSVAANAGETKLVIGMRAGNEGSASSWKKFAAEGASAPQLTMEYTRPPREPTGLTVNNKACDTTSPYTTYGKGNLTFAAASSDPDGDLRSLHFQLWMSGNSANKIVDTARTTTSLGRADIPVDKSRFVNGRTYFWHVKAVDATGISSTYAPPGTVTCGFVYDDAAPSSPDVESTEFPEDDGTGGKWSSTRFGIAGKFVIKPAATGGAGTDKFYWSFNREAYVAERSATVAQGAAGIMLKPPNAGPNVLYVKAADTAGNMSLTASKYLHYVTPGEKADSPGDVTGDKIPDLYAIDGHGDLRLFPSERSGEMDASMSAAHDDGKAIDTDENEDGKADYGYHWVDSAGNNPALISHNGDFTGADGIQDLVARMPDGKLYIYRGDGYGSVDIAKRTEAHITVDPTVPAPSAFTQILAVGDISGDRRPELFVTAGDALWVFGGYTGSAFTTAFRFAENWTERDIVNVGDFNNDGAADLVYRSFAAATNGMLMIRHGKPATGGGTDLGSLSSAANSLNGADATYGTSWTTANIPMMLGTPDVDDNGVPDIWATTPDGGLRYYASTPTGGGPATVIGAGWHRMKRLG
ncbi:VCBS repeat-containing protein [Streptomyces tsukubensis]|uniref:VCBS repeat-containing protein n=1 Tax=Streptomyces tsukubensis TaxID=83656 RepID=UPI00344C576F